MKPTNMRAIGLLLLLSVIATPAFASPAFAAQEEEQAEEQEQEVRNIEEVIIVTASRTEQLLLESPVTITVMDSADIALSPAKNYADLLRGIPGLNITQTSARDINMSSRSATGTLDDLAA